jgi:density-regulated protein DRP1
MSNKYKSWPNYQSLFDNYLLLMSSEAIEEAKEGVANVQITIPPIVVTYCETCRFPLEYCEYSHAILFKKELKAEEKKDHEAASSVPATENVDTTVKQEEKKPEKKKKELFIEIEISRTKGNKHATYVSNLEKFGLNLKDTAKIFSKRFACSSSVAKEDNGQEYIQLTGEFNYELIDFLVEKFSGVIKADMCKVKEIKKKTN